MAKYYLDACIWKDYYENRSDKYRPLGEWALMLINKILEERGIILVSDFLVDELENEYNLREIEKIFRIAFEQNLLERVSTSVFQWKLAVQIADERKVYRGDALHAILARDCGAILVTRDRHFEKLKDIVKVVKPEELI
jgi:predicted nucleic acid-binding protein